MKMNLNDNERNYIGLILHFVVLYLIHYDNPFYIYDDFWLVNCLLLFYKKIIQFFMDLKQGTILFR